MGNNPANFVDPNGLCLKKAWQWTWQNLLEPPYNTLTQPGYNYGMWIYGEKDLRSLYGATLDAAWFALGVYSAIEIVASSGAPYWQYYPKGNEAYSSPWMVRGNSPPYELGNQARKALNLPDYNPATDVRNVDIKWWEFIRGPRSVKGGTGAEYVKGWRWPS